MEIIRDQIAYTLTPQELQEAAEEWKHLCLMHRIISYLAEYHGIPLTMNLPNQEYKAKLLDFYDTYHIPFESLVKANESSVEELINAPDQVYLFLSSLAQTYELDEGYAGVPAVVLHHIIADAVPVGLQNGGQLSPVAEDGEAVSAAEDFGGAEIHGAGGVDVELDRGFFSEFAI